jgi:hypothetical protein
MKPLPSLAVILTLCVCVNAADLTRPIAGPDLVFEERDGLVAVEAEHFHRQSLTEKRAWHLTSARHTPAETPDGDPPHLEGASGGAYLEILPDTRRTHDDRLIHGENFSNQPGRLGVLHYKIHLNNPGRYYVWARAYSTGPEDNGLHVGLNGEWPASGQRLQWCEGKNGWRWESKQRTEQVHCGEPHLIYLDIPAAGEHEIQFSMREDGFEFDKFILTKDREFARPNGAGPASRVKSGAVPDLSTQTPRRKTVLTIEGEQFFINGQPTYAGRTWRGSRIEGLLLNSRMVQGIFDDLNPETAARWAYPDTGRWDADRNTREFVEAMPVWRRHGLLCVVVNLQGGSPEGYSAQQPWDNSAIAADGSLQPDYLARLERIIDRADDLGMTVMLGIFYFGQDQRLNDDEAVKRAVINTVDWVASRGYRNVLIEIANECDNRAYDRGIIKAERVHELVALAQERSRRNNHPLPVSVSYNGGSIPRPNVVGIADYILLHGNGVQNPARLVEMIRTVRAMKEFTPMPIVNNEDDRPWRDVHQGWGVEGNNFVACVTNYVSWGYFDFRQPDEPFAEGFQSVPVNWQISSPRKKAFFGLLAEITGHAAKE